MVDSTADKKAARVAMRRWKQAVFRSTIKSSLSIQARLDQPDSNATDLPTSIQSKGTFSGNVDVGTAIHARHVGKSKGFPGKAVGDFVHDFAQRYGCAIDETILPNMNSSCPILPHGVDSSILHESWCTGSTGFRELVEEAATALLKEALEQNLQLNNDFEGRVKSI